MMERKFELFLSEKHFNTAKKQRAKPQGIKSCRNTKTHSKNREKIGVQTYSNSLCKNPCYFIVSKM